MGVVKLTPQDVFFNWERNHHSHLSPRQIKQKRIIVTPKKERRNLEAQAQKDFFIWLEYQYPELRGCVFSIPNGGKRDKREAASLVKQGLTRGVLDIFCAIPNNKYHGLFIELKIGKNSLTPNQKQMMYRFLSKGYACRVCYGWEQAKEVFEEYIDEIK